MGRYETQRCWWGEDERIELRRQYGYSQNEHPIHRKEARRDEIVAAWDRWPVEKKAAEDRCGYTAARAEWNVASDRYDAFRLRLVHLRTADHDIMAVKATVVTEGYTGEGEIYIDAAIDNTSSSKTTQRPCAFRWCQTLRCDQVRQPEQRSRRQAPASAASPINDP